MGGKLPIAAGLIAVTALLFTLQGKRDLDKDDLSDHSEPPPWPVFSVASRLTSGLAGMHRRATPPALMMMDMAQGFFRSQAILAAVELDVANKLADKRLTCTNIASLTDSDPHNVCRLLKYLASLGIFEEVKPSVFRNSRLSAVLRSDHPNTVKSLVGHIVEDGYLVWSRLLDAVRNSSFIAPHEVVGEDAWKALFSDKRRSERFEKAMSEVDALGLHALKYDYDWSQFKRVVDYGGSRGSVMAYLLASFEELHGLVFDVPHVAKNARDHWVHVHSDLLPRAQFLGGDFFDANSLPDFQPGDAVVLRNILHDWGDEDAIHILKNLRSRMPPTAKLVLIELCPDPHESSQPLGPSRLGLDLHMMVLFQARERTVPEWKTLFAKSGFEFGKVHKLRSTFKLVEALPSQGQGLKKNE